MVRSAGAVYEARKYLAGSPGTVARMGRVASLVEGFETPFGLELLSTVHWVADHEKLQSLENVTAKTYAWNDRKRQFSTDQIALAMDVLVRKGWLKASDA